MYHAGSYWYVIPVVFNNIHLRKWTRIAFVLSSDDIDSQVKDYLNTEKTAPIEMLNQEGMMNARFTQALTVIINQPCTNTSSKVIKSCVVISGPGLLELG